MSDTYTPEKAEKSGLFRILQNTAWLLGGKTFGGILSLFYLAIVTRTLGVEGFGQFALIVGTGQAIALFVSFQTWQVIVRFVDAKTADADDDRYSNLIALCTLFELAGGLAGVALAYGFVAIAGPYLGWDAVLSGQAFAFAAVILLAIKSTPTGVLRVANRFDLTAYAESVVPLVRMIGALVIWLTQPTIAGFLLVWAAGEVISALTCWALAYRQSAHVMRFPTPSRARAAWRQTEGIGAFLFISNAGTTLNGFAQNIGLIIIGLFVSPAAAGLYRIASQLSGAMAKISTLLSRAIFAEVNWARADGGKDAMRALYGRANRLLYISGALVLAVIVMAGKPVLTLMSGPEFAPAYPIMVMLGLAAVINLIGAMNEPTLLSGEGAGKAMVLQAAATGVYAGLMTLFLPPYGAMGAAGAMVGFAIVRQILLSRAAKAHLVDD
jgi:O-antigen/teichoic acid export membrane protein